MNCWLWEQVCNFRNNAVDILIYDNENLFVQSLMSDVFFTNRIDSVVPRASGFFAPSARFCHSRLPTAAGNCRYFIDVGRLRSRDERCIVTKDQSCRQLLLLSDAGALRWAKFSVIPTFRACSADLRIHRDRERPWCEISGCGVPGANASMVPSVYSCVFRKN